MPRPADRIFLKLAVKGGYLAREDADDVWEELCRLEVEGEPSKARLLCLELGFIDGGLARSLKHEVRAYLDEKAEVESRSERQVAGFELLERLGAGAMGMVYKARHLRLNKLVALKLLNPNFADDQTYVTRFLQEARAAGSLNHPNVVQAYDVGQDGGVHWIAMEFVDGKTVKDLIERRGFLEEQAAIEIVIQVVEALGHAHENQLVHRDVKPANVMITRDGQAKLLDLGLARRTDVENGLTGEGKAIGTPYFMAPEQALDKGADFRADFYALGATLFNMVTGEKPYTGSTPVAVMNAHLKAPIPDASKVNPKVSRGLAAITKKLLAKRPADRYQSHTTLIADLESVLAGLAPELKGGSAPAGIATIQRRSGQGRVSPARSTGSRPQAPSRRGRVVAALAAAAGVCAVLGAFALTSGARAESNDVAAAPVTATPPAPAAAPTAEADAERAASVLYAELTQGMNGQRVEELSALAQRYPTTRVGQRAAREADMLRGQIEMRERTAFEARRAELLGQARAGDRRAAVEGFLALGRQVESEHLKTRAQAEARALEAELKAEVRGVEAEVDALLADGREAQAADILRRSANLHTDDERGAVLERAKEIGERGRAAEEARAEAQRGSKQGEARDAARVALLPTQLRELVKQGELTEALSAARQAAGAVSDAEGRQRAQAHVAALTDAIGLEGMAAASFAAHVGETVSLERRAGARIEGTLVAAADGKLTVAIEAGSGKAELLVAVSDLSERDVWRAARRLRGARDAAYLRGVAAIKLYRGDEDAADAQARAADVGADLALVVEDLRGDEPRAPKGDALLAMRKPEAEEQPAAPAPAAGDEGWDRTRKLIDQRGKLFPEASDIGWGAGLLELVYDYQSGQTFGAEWNAKGGRAYPTPAGQVERVGLVLEGRDGRAEFAPTLEGDATVKVRFMSQMIGRKGRLAIVLEGDEGRRRVACELGQLVVAAKGKVRSLDGEPQNAAVRSQTYQVLELVKSGRTLVTKFNGVEVARTELDEDLSTYRLSLEWGHAALNLVSLRVQCVPAQGWVDAKLRAK